MLSDPERKWFRPAEPSEMPQATMARLDDLKAQIEALQGPQADGAADRAAQLETLRATAPRTSAGPGGGNG